MPVLKSQKILEEPFFTGKFSRTITRRDFKSFPSYKKNVNLGPQVSLMSVACVLHTEKALYVILVPPSLGFFLVFRMKDTYYTHKTYLRT